MTAAQHTATARAYLNDGLYDQAIDQAKAAVAAANQAFEASNQAMLRAKQDLDDAAYIQYEAIRKSLTVAA